MDGSKGWGKRMREEGYGEQEQETGERKDRGLEQVMGAEGDGCWVRGLSLGRGRGSD